MSKAFTKESTDDDSEQDALEDADASDSQTPKGTKNYMTPAGAGRLKEELRRLLNVDRPELVKTVSWAASNGDRSENADYIYGKRRLREIDRRIRFLTKRLDASEIVDPALQAETAQGKALFGATVTIRGEEGDLRTYRIVGIDETEVKKGHVSWISPVGKALLQSKVGDVVTLKTPRGEEELEIIAVKYESF